MNKYLVTGASGFVAYYFFDYLNSIKENCEVLGIDAEEPENMNLYAFPHLKLKFSKINLLDFSALKNALVSFMPTHIVHLASFSIVSKSWQEPIASFINNNNIFLNLVEIIRLNNLKCRLLSVGSSEEYGNVSNNDIPIKETVPLNPVSPYAIARVSQEMLSRCYVSSHGLDIVLTRSFNHIGPRQREIFVIPSMVKQILENKNAGHSNIKLITGDVSVVRDFTDVRDVVKAYHFLLQKGISGELYNICSGTGRSIKEIIDMLLNLLNIRAIIEIDKEKMRPNDNKIIIGDNEKIRNLTGWQPEIQLMDSLRDIIDFWRQILSYG